MYHHLGASALIQISIYQPSFPLCCLSDAEGSYSIKVEAAIDLQACLNAIMPTQRISPIIATAFKTWTNSNLQTCTQVQGISQGSEMVISCSRNGTKRKCQLRQAWRSTCRCPVCSSKRISLQIEKRPGELKEVSEEFIGEKNDQRKG